MSLYLSVYHVSLPDLQGREQALEPFGWTALVGAGERWNQGDLADSALVSGTGSPLCQRT